MASDNADKDDIADALSRMADGLPDKPQRPLQPSSPSSAAEFRGKAQPAAPRAPEGAPTPAPAAKAKPPRPQRPDRPGRPEDPPTTAWSEDEAAQVAAHYEPLSEVINDDDSVIVPAPELDVFTPHTPPTRAPGAPRAIGIPSSLNFRRTVIPILLTCGLLLVGIGALRWVRAEDSIFADMSIPVSATLCGTGAFLLLVAVLNMLQVRAELAAAAKRAA